MFLEEVFPSDIYDRLVQSFPDPDLYDGSAARHHGMGGGRYTRSMFPLTPANLRRLDENQGELWHAVALALTAPELQAAVYVKLARDLAFRYNCRPAAVANLNGYSRPTLFRETDGFEIPPHTDTRRKIVTMHLYLPADHSQMDLGTALYRRRLLAWPFGHWQRRFAKVKQFPFLPNSGYAFVVNNSLRKQSWHGRERLPQGSGVRNTLLNTFYETPREAFTGY
jgi:hypothetical protein